MKYLYRSVKYFISLCVLTVVLAGALYATGMAAGTPSDLVRLLVFTPRGWFLIGAIVVLSAIYPRAGYLTLRIEGDAERMRAKLDEALRNVGFIPAGEKEGVRYFRAAHFARRLRLRFDDRITLSQDGRWIELEGPRKVIARLEYKLKSVLRQEND